MPANGRWGFNSVFKGLKYSSSFFVLEGGNIISLYLFNYSPLYLLDKYNTINALTYATFFGQKFRPTSVDTARR